MVRFVLKVFFKLKKKMYDSYICTSRLGLLYMYDILYIRKSYNKMLRSSRSCVRIHHTQIFTNIRRIYQYFYFPVLLILIRINNPLYVLIFAHLHTNHFLFFLFSLVSLFLIAGIRSSILSAKYCSAMCLLLKLLLLLKLIKKIN